MSNENLYCHHCHEQPNPSNSAQNSGAQEHPKAFLIIHNPYPNLSPSTPTTFSNGRKSLPSSQHRRLRGSPGTEREEAVFEPNRSGSEEPGEDSGPDPNPQTRPFQTRQSPRLCSPRDAPAAIPALGLRAPRVRSKHSRRSRCAAHSKLRAFPAVWLRQWG